MINNKQTKQTRTRTRTEKGEIMNIVYQGLPQSKSTKSLDSAVLVWPRLVSGEPNGSGDRHLICVSMCGGEDNESNQLWA
jgi:hypothetical protein